MISQAEFRDLLTRFTAAATRGDGQAFAACFTDDGVYRDYIYGDHRGRPEIAHMLEDLFHRDATRYHWQMFEPVTDGVIGYAWSLSTFVSTVAEFKNRRVVIDGMSRFRIRDGLIEEYAESVNGGVAMAQLGVQPARMEKVFRKWSDWLRARPETQAYLADKGA